MIAPSSEERLLEFLYACPVGLVECDEAGEIGMINPHAMQHLLPLAGARDPGNLFATLEQHAPEIRNLSTAFSARTGRICDGHRIVVDLGKGVHDPQPKVLACTLVKLAPDRLMATFADISAQVAQEQRLRQADTWFASLLDEINDYAVLTITPSGEIAAVNEAFTRQTGRGVADIIGRSLASVLATDAEPEGLGVDEQIAVATRDGWHLQQGWQHRTNGGRYWCQRLVVARTDGDSAQPVDFAVVLRDVPHREAATDLRRLLTCDHLTGAANRMQFSRVLDNARVLWAETRAPLALVVLDLDHFKGVNDTHGHPAGDRLLCAAADACTALLPPRGVFCRLGGEEFSALLPGCDRAQAAHIAETMRQAIADIEMPVRGLTLRATASFGYATLDEAAGSADLLMSLADQRLYVAKRDGRNRVHHPQPEAVRC